MHFWEHQNCKIIGFLEASFSVGSFPALCLSSPERDKEGDLDSHLGSFLEVAAASLISSSHSADSSTVLHFILRSVRRELSAYRIQGFMMTLSPPIGAHIQTTASCKARQTSLLLNDGNHVSCRSHGAVGQLQAPSLMSWQGGPSHTGHIGHTENYRSHVAQR